MIRSMLLCLSFGWCGCHYRIRVLSQPDGAKVYRNDQLIGSTPHEFSLWWIPFKKDVMQVSALGHRTLIMPLAYPFYRLPEDLVQLQFGRVLGFVPNEQRLILIQETD